MQWFIFILIIVIVEPFMLIAYSFSQGATESRYFVRFYFCSKYDDKGSYSFHSKKIIPDKIREANYWNKVNTLELIDNYLTSFFEE